MTIIEACELAQNKGCTLRTIQYEDSVLYWIENPHFIGKPFECLDDLITFIHHLPSLRPFCVLLSRV